MSWLYDDKEQECDDDIMINDWNMVYMLPGSCWYKLHQNDLCSETTLNLQVFLHWVFELEF